MYLLLSVTLFILDLTDASERQMLVICICKGTVVSLDRLFNNGFGLIFFVGVVGAMRHT